MTLFIVIYSLPLGLQRSAIQQDSKEKRERERGRKRHREREREGKKRAPFIYALIFPPLWWMAFLLCHLGLWKMFSGAEEIASFHIIQIQLSARAISMLSARFFETLDLHSDLRGKSRYTQRTWLENMTIYNFPILVSWLSRVLKVSRLFGTYFHFWLLWKYELKVCIKTLQLVSYTVYTLYVKRKNTDINNLTWNLSGVRIYKTKPSSDSSLGSILLSVVTSWDGFHHSRFICPYQKWSMFLCLALLPVF